MNRLVVARRPDVFIISTGQTVLRPRRLCRSRPQSHAGAQGVSAQLRDGSAPKIRLKLSLLWPDRRSHQKSSRRRCLFRQRSYEHLPFCFAWEIRRTTFKNCLSSVQMTFPVTTSSLRNAPLRTDRLLRGDELTRRGARKKSRKRRMLKESRKRRMPHRRPNWTARLT